MRWSRLFVAGGLLLSLAAHADYMDHFVVREDVGLRKAPYLGKAELLVIPVEVLGFPRFDRARLERFFSGDDPSGFVKFYEVSSLGRYQPHVTVAPTIAFADCPLPKNLFPDCAIRRGDFTAFQPGLDMIREVVRRARDAGVDFSKLDVNGRRGVADGWADGVLIISNTPFGGIALPFGFFNRGDNLNGGTGGPMVVGGVKVNHVAVGGSANGAVMIHEFGHLLGLTDLYSENPAYPGLHLSFMGAGGTALPDAETRFRLRWGQWHQVAGRRKVVVQPAETSGEVWRFGVGNEYFLVENRGPGLSFDKHLTHRGLALYHVDRTVRLQGDEGHFQERTLNCVNCDPWRPYIMWVQADGAFHIQHDSPPDWPFDLFRDGDTWGATGDTTPFSESNPRFSSNLYSGEVTGFSIEDVVVRDDGSIEATFSAPETGQCGERLCDADAGVGCEPASCVEPPPTPPAKSGCAVSPAGPLVLVALAFAWRRRRLTS